MRWVFFFFFSNPFAIVLFGLFYLILQSDAERKRERERERAGASLPSSYINKQQLIQQTIKRKSSKQQTVSFLFPSSNNSLKPMGFFLPMIYVIKSYQDRRRRPYYIFVFFHKHTHTNTAAKMMFSCERMLIAGFIVVRNGNNTYESVYIRQYV